MNGLYPRLVLLLAMAAAKMFGATSDDSASVLPELVLLDGRKLQKVVIKSYDPATDKLLLVADGKAQTVAAKLVPLPLADQLRATTRKAGETVSLHQPSVSPNPPPPRRAPPQTGSVSRPAPIPSSAQATSMSPDQQAAKLIAQHRAVAQSRADKYFRNEFQVGPSNSTLLSLQFEFESTKPVENWTGRCTTLGKAYLEYYMRGVRGIQRKTSEFEVVTEQLPDDSPKVIQINVKN